MARPQVKIDSDDIYKLAKYGCTNEEIADFHMCSVDTITRRFADILTKARANEKIRLRQLQWQAAEKGNSVMLVWLGKQKLKQKDQMETDNNNTNKTEITYVAEWAAPVKEDK